MTRRRFTDANGVEWQVYDTVGAGEVRAGLIPGRSDVFKPARMWLAFETEDERRRLEPAPRGWEDAPDEELRRLLELATLILKRTRRPPTDSA